MKEFKGIAKMECELGYTIIFKAWQDRIYINREGRSVRNSGLGYITRKDKEFHPNYGCASLAPDVKRFLEEYSI